MRLTNNQIAFLAILFTIISLVCNSIIYQRASIAVTGKSTATADLKICLNRPPVLTLGCSSQATIGSQYSCDVDASDEDNTIISGSQTLAFSDNVILFDINPLSGMIQFTPNSSQAGNYTITIMVEDNSTCANSIDSDLLNLTVSEALIEAYCGDGICNGAETCSSCPSDCGVCPVAPAPAAPGGGGGGAGPGESAEGCYIDFCKVDSKILRAKENELIQICFMLGYTLKITKVDKNGFTMFMSNTKETATINLDEKKMFDIDKDGLLDISIQLVKIQEKEIWIFFEQMEGADILCKKTIEDALVIDPSIIRISITLGDSVEKTLLVSNIGLDTLGINVELVGLDNIVRLEQDSFSLKAFQNKIFKVIFDATGEDIEAGVYNGKIIFNAGAIKKEVLVIVEVETKKVIFDIKIGIPSEYKRISLAPATFEGAIRTKEEGLQDVSVNIDIYDLKGVEKIDIHMTYQIRGTEGNIIVSEEEDINVRGDISFTRRLPLPRDVGPGQYIFIVIAKSGDLVETASDVFEVVSIELLAPLAPTIIILIILAIIFAVLAYHQIKIKQLPKRIYRKMFIERVKEAQRKYEKKKALEVEINKQKERLQKKLKSLEEVYKLGYLSENTYNKSREHIEKVLKSSKK